MGILEFYSQFISKYNTGPRSKIPYRCSGVAIDLNALIHNNVGDVYGTTVGTPPGKLKTILKKLETSDGKEELETVFHNQLWGEIISLVKLFQPDTYLVIAADGVPPVAKISQQRTRRYKAQIEEEPQTFNKLKISPGTTFMRNLDEFLREKISAERANLAHLVIYSSHLVPGEGEHKILDYFREGKLTGNNYHIIVGNDSDFIPLLFGLKLPRLVIHRGKNYNGELNDPIYIDRIRENILRDLGVVDLSGNIKDDFKEAEVIDDFVLMVILIGNDFLPAMPGLNLLPKNMETLFMAYKGLVAERRYLTRGGTLNLKNFRRFIQEVAKLEPELLAYLRMNRKMEPIPAITESIEILDEAERKVKFDYPKFYGLWWKQFEPRRISSSKIPETIKILWKDVNYNPKPGVIKSYFDSLNWILAYYLKGTYGINLNWNYPYYYPPTITDLAQYLENPDTNVTWNIPEYSFNTLHQLLVIIPPKYSGLIPKPVRHLITGSLSDLAPEDFTIDQTGTLIGYGQGIPMIPIVNPYRVIYEVSKIDFDTETLEKYAQAEDFEPEATVTEQTAKERFANMKKKLRKEINIRKASNREYYGRPNESGESYRGRGRGRGSGRGFRRGSGRGRGSYAP